MRYIAYIFWFIVIILGVLFATLNSNSVAINFYIKSFNVYLPLLLLIELAIGALIGMLAVLPALIRVKAGNRKLKQRAKQIEQEVQNLRNIPIKDAH